MTGFLIGLRGFFLFFSSLLTSVGAAVGQHLRAALCYFSPSYVRTLRRLLCGGMNSFSSRFAICMLRRFLDGLGPAAWGPLVVVLVQNGGALHDTG